MSFGRKHPEAVQAAVGEAALRGLKVPAIVRALAAGTLPGFPKPYELPVESARYYAKTAKNKAAASTITDRAAGDPSRAIDYMARQLMSEAELGIHQVREAKTRDPAAVKQWADVLRVIAPLVRPEPAEDAKGKAKRDKRPSDPLTERLTSPSHTTLVEVANEALRETKSEAQDTPHHWPSPTDQATPRGGVLAQPPFIASS